MKIILLAAVLAAGTLQAQEMKWNLSADSTRWVKLNVTAQTWLRYTDANPGTLVDDEPRNSIVDIGIRRGRIQFTAQVTNRALLYLQYGLNNFNAATSINGNRKLQAFFHDIFAEYRVSHNDEVKLGLGLTIANGLSRFSQPSIGTIMTTDVPVFAQTTVDQTDEFSRKLSATIRGQVGPIDYRFAVSDPFPITSNGNTPPPISQNASFAQYGHRLQGQGYVIWQFMDHEPHTTPYMIGTYLGSRSVFNVAVGGIYQPRAMWRTTSLGDTVFDAMAHLAIESFFDAPINHNGTALSAYAGFFHTNYGKNYLRYNGIMNPATAMSSQGVNPKPLGGVGPTYGNAFPMFGTGNVIYAQCGIYLPQSMPGGTGLMPYVSASYASYDRLDGRGCLVGNMGASWMLDGHRSKISVDVQNRPTYGELPSGDIVNGARQWQVLMQYQLSL
ncbi:MAG TPA: hypothetical protein VK147_02340 [Candidatus Didemnitutus sp.]|nr:hypothetical protein [Candidatus Didemnitutus sp.]